MRACWCAVAFVLAACGGDDEAALVDASADPDAAATDAAIDAATDAPACQRQVLFAPGSDPLTQGWMVAASGPAMMTGFADHLRMETATAPQATVSAHQLLYRPQAVTSGEPFVLEVVMEVVAVDRHNQFDAGAAILGSLTPPFGAGNDRAQMLYLDADRIGWADDSASHAVAVTSGASHTYLLAVDADGTARVSIDGAPALTRAGFTTNGTIAIGDQTNDRAVDSMLRLRSVALLCP